MTEEADIPATGGVGAGLDSEAISLAIPGASRAEADALLRQQRRFIALQAEHLHEQRELQLSRLRLGRISDFAKVTLQAMTGVVGATIAIVAVAAMWNASRTEGMEVEAFSVPPQLAQAGMTGEAIADDFTDRLAQVRDIAVSNSLSNSGNVRKDSSDDIKVEIPETGVSLGQAWRYLRLWLGHERHLTGSLRATGPGQITQTITLDGRRVSSVSGAAADLGKLEQQAAEQVFSNAEPLNYVLYLLGQGRIPEALTAVEHLVQIANGPEQQGNAYSLWAGLTRSIIGDPVLAVARARLSMKIDPKLMASHREAMWAFAAMGHDQEALEQADVLPAFPEKEQPAILQGPGFREMSAEGLYIRDISRGAFAQAVSDGFCLPPLLCSQTAQSMSKAEFSARAHDGAAARALITEAMSTGPGAGKDLRIGLGLDIVRPRYFERANVEDWRSAAAHARAFAAHIESDPEISPKLKALRLRVEVAQLLAVALARGGDLKGAEAAIAPTTGDCYECVRARAQLAVAAGQWSRADYWFARAIHDGPSLPFAYTDRGRAWLARGKPDAAIAQFTLAVQKGPQFADPLEHWGEALMAKNQSHLALEKFAKADKFAPNWGRLHLKWAEALRFAGKPEEARKEFARAAALDLTSAERSELTQLSRAV